MKPALKWLALLMPFLGFCACESPEGVVVAVEAPLSVQKGKEFVIVATVENTASTQQTLVSLDIADAYLDGIAILRTEPDNVEASHVPLDNTMSYVFNIPMDAGQRVTIQLYAKAVKEGDFNAEIDFCINTDFHFLSKPIRTIVE